MQNSFIYINSTRYQRRKITEECLISVWSSELCAAKRRNQPARHDVHALLISFLKDTWGFPERLRGSTEQLKKQSSTFNFLPPWFCPKVVFSFHKKKKTSGPLNAAVQQEPASQPWLFVPVHLPPSRGYSGVGKDAAEARDTLWP